MYQEKFKIAISIDFLNSFAQLPKDQQKKAREFMEKFRANPTLSSINYETIHNVKDKNLRSVRLDQTYRCIVHKPDRGNVYMLLWVDHHDRAYQWARCRVFKIHPETGSLQILNVQEEIQPELKAEVPPRKIEEIKPLFSAFRDRELTNLGVPELLLDEVRDIIEIEELEHKSDQYPVEVYDALYGLAAGLSLQEVNNQVNRAKENKEKIDTENFEAALEHIDTRQRFYVVEGADDLKMMLDAPLELWRVFLHPSQRKYVQFEGKGPIRILGGAGTGKTVVAMHRVLWLLKKYPDPQQRILFTTFTRNLATDIKNNLQLICSPSEMRRVDVINLDAWISKFLKSEGKSFDYTSDAHENRYWENALKQFPEVDLQLAFFKEEYQQVIQAQGIESFSEYQKASRIGRGRRISRKDKSGIWKVVDHYRKQLVKENKKSTIDAARDAKNLILEKGIILPYRSIIIDEAQDLNHEAYKAIRAMIPRQENDIFIVGDGHQRIYNNHVILSHCGVEIRGRSRKLYINYRTTEEIRKWATLLLEGAKIDDLDGDEDPQDRYRSLMHGRAPIVENFKTKDLEFERIAEFIEEAEEQGVPPESICLVARSKKVLEYYERKLESKGWDTLMINPQTKDNQETEGIRLATMHRIKGLEFEVVMIGSVNQGLIPPSNILRDCDNEISKDSLELSERCLLHVAATRARKETLVTSYGTPSTLLTLT